MSHRSLDLRHPLDSCTFLLHSWRPFLDSDQQQPPANSFQAKRPCLSDRTTSFSIDLSKLTIVDDDRAVANGQSQRRSSYRLIARKRRRRGSRSASGRSSDRSGTRRCCSVGASAAYGTCSDFPVAMGTDSSGELFVNGADSSNWPSDVSEARNSRRDNRGDGGGNGGSGEKDGLIGVGFNGGLVVGFDGQGTESGYGSEPGYRGDAELGYGDEIDEEEDDSRVLFWGDQFGGKISLII